MKSDGSSSFRGGEDAAVACSCAKLRVSCTSRSVAALPSSGACYATNGRRADQRKPIVDHDSAELTGFTPYASYLCVVAGVQMLLQ